MPPRRRSRALKATHHWCQAVPAWQVDLLVFNEKVPQFADRHVRRAINYAHRPPGARQRGDLRHRQARRLVLPAEPAVLPATTPMLGYSLATAKAELAKSQVPARASRSSLLIERRRAEVAHVRPDHPAAAEADRDQRHDPSQLDHAAYPRRRSRSSTTRRCSSTTRSTTSATRTRWRRSRSTSRTAARTRTGSSYDNPAAIKLVHQAQAEFNAAKRAALYAQIQAIVAQDAPFVAARLPAVHLRVVEQGARLRGEPRRRVPAGGRLAGLTGRGGPAQPSWATRGGSAARSRRRRGHGRHVPAAARRARAIRRGSCSACTPARRRSRAAPRSWGSTARCQPVLVVPDRASRTATSARRIYYHVRSSSLIAPRIAVTASLVGVATLFSVMITVPLAVARRGPQGPAPPITPCALLSVVGLGHAVVLVRHRADRVFALACSWFAGRRLGDLVRRASARRWCCPGSPRRSRSSRCWSASCASACSRCSSRLRRDGAGERARRVAGARWCTSPATR